MSNFRAVVATGAAHASGTLLLWPGKNLRTGERKFSAQFSDITSLESDLLRVASAVYACDLAFKRGEREDVVRNIDLTIPVSNYQAFKATADELEVILWLLSDDNWRLTFKRGNGTPEVARTWPEMSGKTILFSGGIDSFSAVVELIEEHGANAVHLASHYTGNLVIRQCQLDLYSYIEKQLGKPLWTAIRTGAKNAHQAPFPTDQQREDTQRTRSFMFLCIAALAARRSGHHELVMIAENGQMAIHIPLTEARIGPFSTHTAHPEFVRRLGSWLSTILDTDFTLNNPYLYQTKAEVVKRIAAKHSSALKQTISCWRASRVSQFNHCGECIPCLIRRIALESNNLLWKEYQRNLLVENIKALAEDDEGKRNLVDLLSFAYTFSLASSAELEQRFPALINEDIDLLKAIAMYKRFAKEAAAVLKGYKWITELMPASTSS